MVQDKKVSIILCFYNEEKYLSKAIDSVLAQTYSNFELIIVNDGSTDRSDEIVKSYHDERIVYKAYEGNKRLAYARNRGLELATGDYVGFFDADDIMMPDKMERQVCYLNENPDIILVSGGYVFMDSEGKCDDDVTDPKYLSDDQIRAYMLVGNCIAVGAALFRREIISRYVIRLDEKNRVSEDYRLWIEMLPHGKFANMQGAFYKYRVNHGSKAALIVKRDESAYKTEIENVLKVAWKKQGFSLAEKDIEFIAEYVFLKRKISNVQALVQGIRTYKKIKDQLKADEKKNRLIIKYYKEKWFAGYRLYCIYKKITGK